jgi:hypothetical protein
MNDKILNNRELAQVKRIAQNVDADYQKVCKLNEKIAELTKERDELQQGIDEMEAPVVRKTGGYKSTDIYEKVIIPQFDETGAPKTDKEGRQIKVTKYVLRYEDTILPPAKEPLNPDAGVTENEVSDCGIKDCEGMYVTPDFNAKSPSY